MVVVLDLSHIKLLDFIKGARENVNSGKRGGDLGPLVTSGHTINNDTKSEKILQYIGNHRPKRVNYISKSLSRYHHIHSHQVRKNSEA